MAGMFEHGASTDKASTRVFKSQLNKVYMWYTGGFFLFVVALAILEQMGCPRTGSASSSCSQRWACMPESAS